MGIDLKELALRALQSIIEPLINILISAAKQVADLYLKGEELKVFQKKLVVAAYFLGNLFYADTVGSTETAYDNRAMDEALELFEDTASEGNFELVNPPEFDEPDEPEE